MTTNGKFTAPVGFGQYLMHFSIALVSMGLNSSDEQKLNHKVFSNFLPQHSEQSSSFSHPHTQFVFFR